MAAIRRHYSPGSVVVEVLGSNYVWRNIARRLRIVLTLIAQPAPIVEAIPVRGIIDMVGKGCTAGEASLPIALHLYGTAFASTFPFTMPHCDQGCIAAGIDIEAVLTGLCDRKRGVRCVHFVDLAT